MKTCTKDKTLLSRVKENLIKDKLIEKGDVVLVALSGGADSVCLLTVLYALSFEMGFTLKAAHLNHGIRGDEAERDEKFAENLCETLGVPIYISHKDIPALSKGRSEEEVGREERYKFFFRLSEENNGAKIAVAHNKNDVAETMVMRLVRGTSVFGLSGIPKKNGLIIRPLLNIERSEIEKYLKDNNVPFVTDGTNLKDEYLRNRIRHKVLPEMEKINENYLSSIHKTAGRIALAADFIKEEAMRCYGEITEVIKIKKLQNLHEALMFFIISESAYKAGVKEISEKHIRDILSLEKSSSGKRVDIPGGFEAVRMYDEIKIMEKKEKADYYIKLKIGKNYIDEAGYTVTLRKSKKGIDLNKAGGLLFARPKKEGDAIEIKGTDGRKKIKNLYIDEKLPLDKRDKYPLIVSGDKVVFALGRCHKDFISDENSKEVYTIKVE